MLRRRFGSFEPSRREMDHLRREVNYLFDRTFAGLGERTGPDYPSLNVWTNEDGAVVTAEEHSIVGGLGGAVAEVVVENTLVPMARVGIKDMFGESGKPEELLVKYGLTVESIMDAVKTVLKRKK